MIEKKTKQAHVAAIPDKSEVRESTKPVPGCIMAENVPCDRETRKAFFYSKNPDKKKPDEKKAVTPKEVVSHIERKRTDLKTGDDAKFFQLTAV